MNEIKKIHRDDIGKKCHDSALDKNGIFNKCCCSMKGYLYRKNTTFYFYLTFYT